MPRSTSNVPSAVRLASRGKARATIITQPGATEAERHAAEELAHWLGEIAGAAFDVRELDADAPMPAIVVGPGAVAAEYFADVDLAGLGGEEHVMRTRDGRLLLAGGRPRGTLYAVYRFLQDQLGVRWYAPWCTHVPKRATLSVPDLDLRGKPAFEYREPFWYPAFDGDWAARNCVNSAAARLEGKHGGHISYTGFVHTFYPLVPPEEHFEKHPEWYSMIDGVRKHDRAELCCTNPELRDFVVERVKQWLRESPGVDIVSVSQNDWEGWCECPECKAVDEREGSHIGSVLELVNYVAEKIEPEFPDVAVDTLAYWYTRKAPKTIKPRHNVIVRLCTIECDFRQPLEGPTNTAFARDIRDWNKLTDRLYVWDYTTNFAYYMLPHPNYEVLGPNVRFFHRHGVRGLFEQGAYQSHGAEFAELRAWVLAQLMWNPYQDDQALIDEFLKAYYGEAAAKYIRMYMRRMLAHTRGHYMGCFSHASAPHLGFEGVRAAERLWTRAELAAQTNSDHLWRVRQARACVWFSWLVRWTSLRRESLSPWWGGQWPLVGSQSNLAQQWLQTVTSTGPEGWTPATHVREDGTTPHQFVEVLGEDPPDPIAAFAHCPKPTADSIEIQDAIALLLNEPWGSDARFDALATDNLAARIPGNHGRKAYEAHVRRWFPRQVRIGYWIVKVWARVEAEPGAPADALAFRAGVGAVREGPDVAEIAVTVGETSADEYRAFAIGPVDLNDAMQVWVASPGNEHVRYVWVDRLTLERAK